MGQEQIMEELSGRVEWKRRGLRGGKKGRGVQI